MSILVSLQRSVEAPAASLRVYKEQFGKMKRSATSVMRLKS